MFNQHSAVIYITNHSVELYGIHLHPQPKITGRKVFPWNRNQKLLPIFSELAPSIHKRTVRILLSKELSYTVKLNIPRSIKKKQFRSFINKQLESIVPEKLTDADWDFKTIASSEKETEVLVFAPVKEFFVHLSNVLQTAQVSVEAIEPEAIAVTRNKNPIIGIALKSDIAGKDQNVLNMHLIKPQAADDHNNKRPQMTKKKLIQIISIIFGVVLIGYGGFFIYTNKPTLLFPQTEPEQTNPQQETEQKTEPSSSPTSQPTKTPIEINLEDFKILVQNGSGEKGASAAIAEILEENGALAINTENADTFGFSETEVSVKEDITPEIVGYIQELLPEYVVVEGNTLDVENDYDLIIIVGEKN